MKQHITDLLSAAIKSCQSQGLLPETLEAKIVIEHCRDKQHGDFASNLALTLAKTAKTNPRALAEQLIAALPESEQIASAAIAGPGFINFKIGEAALSAVIKQIFAQGSEFGRNQQGCDTTVHIEYVSANPTGPLHVGHGRGAAFGACVANLLTANGYLVHREYYVNDAGRQMRILGLSTWIRYLQLAGESIELPGNAYQGQYIVDIAKQLADIKGQAFSIKAEQLSQTLAQDLSFDDDKESYIDALIDGAKQLLGNAAFEEIKQFSLENILDDIRDDLEQFGVSYENWYPESQLYLDGSFAQGIAMLEERGYVYEQGGAKWFRATEFGDDKDRVLIRDNGQPTYFASDVAYHYHKMSEYDQVIDVFGADHHGYIGRIKAFLQGLGQDPERLLILLVQFAVLYRGKTKVQMSTRSGEFVTLRELREEVGNDAARFFYIMRKPEQHLDFDLELAKSKSNENPVYYIQYAHARICSVMRKLDASDWTLDQEEGLASLDKLTSDHETTLLQALSRYPEVINKAGMQHAPHSLAHYMQELANHFHSYYNNSVFLIDQNQLRNARLVLILATKQVLSNSLGLLGVSAPDSM